MSEYLLTTKLNVPALRQQLVHRPRLTEKLQAGLRRKLTLVSAPAGFGKSTLVVDWLHDLPRDPGTRVAWLSLDEADNEPIRFLRYMLAALDRADDLESDLWVALIDMLHSSQTTPFESVFPSLINRIADASGNWLMVLDDYHLVETEAIHDALNFLLENAPPQFHVLIITRADPPLPLARLRVRNQLNELRAADLRFSADEAAAFLNQAMGLDLKLEDITALESRTEGWIAGLQLAAISLQGQADTSDLIQSFTGSNRHVMDYLIEDVLSKQPEDLQSFLLNTSILERLNDALCDVVTGQDNSGQVLKHLDQRNLFIISLDNERRWYRYHQLFSELLRQRLALVNPGLLKQLHSRAAGWYEEQGYLLDAINHAFAGEDIATAVRLIEMGAEDALERSDFGFIFSVMARIPEDERKRSPWLFVYHAWALVMTGKLDQAASMLAHTDWLLGCVTSEAEKKKLLGYLAGVKALYSSWKWDDDTMFACVEQAFDCLPEMHWVLGYCAISRGAAYWGKGELAKAVDQFKQAEEIGRISGHVRVSVTSKMYLAQSYEQQGRLHQARSLCQDAFLLTQADGKKMPLRGYLNVDIARSLYQLNELEKAAEHLRQGITFCRQMGDNRVEKLAYYQLVRIHLAQGNVEEAERTVEIGLRTHPGKEPLVDMRGLEYPQVLVWLAQKKFREVEAWLQSENVGFETLAFFKARLIFTMRARALLALGREYRNDAYLEQAQEILKDLETLTANTEWESKKIEILVLQALALQAQDKLHAAVETLEAALRQAAREGFVRVFVDEGPSMQLLLKMVKTEDKRLREYVCKLIAAFGSSDVTVQPLIDPLSEREIEVLEKIAEGLTNAEVASQLFLSLNTVKVHTRNIYQKLGTSNRTQAVARAREIGILASL